ncbi:MAG: hypothetical protein DMF70_07360 [Acidobacteria bacterium]|nr:MAG: hypothetical protein DMF70_07360 [Acidobacteriota bacterium]
MCSRILSHWPFHFSEVRSCESPSCSLFTACSSSSTSAVSAKGRAQSLSSPWRSFFPCSCSFGIEVALIPSGEVKNPARTVPRSAYLALVITTIIYILIQLVAQGALGSDLANPAYKDAPLAEAAAKFLGHIGRIILLAGATISAFGFVTSDILSSPRMIFAFGRDDALPGWFAHVHRRYRSPDVSIITYAVLAFALSITGTFEKLAVLSNVAVLLMYLLCCAACGFLVQRDVRADGAQPFSFPGMRIVPVLAIIAIIWILGQSSISETSIGNDTRSGLRMAAWVLIAASVFYIIWKSFIRTRRATE